jgi:hypothetical protein
MAAMVVLLASAASAAGIAVTASGSTHGPALIPTASNLPPLSNLAARAFWCGDAYNASRHGGCHSPDGKWAIVVENEGKGCTLTVTRTGTGRRERIGQPDSWGCAPDLWVGHRFVVQEGFDEPKHRVISIDPPSRHVKILARFRTFVVSPNERWIAGEAELRHDGTPQLIAVRSLTSNTCRVVIRATSPSQDVSVDKSPWSSGPRDQTTVVWRTVVQNGRKIRVVSGPGTGFTRNSRSVIVATWENSPYGANKRLVKFNLSSLHTPCPAHPCRLDVFGKTEAAGQRGVGEEGDLVDLAPAQGEHHHAPGLRAQVAAEGRLAVGAGRAYL